MLGTHKLQVIRDLYTPALYVYFRTKNNGFRTNTKLSTFPIVDN